MSLLTNTHVPLLNQNSFRRCPSWVLAVIKGLDLNFLEAKKSISYCALVDQGHTWDLHDMASRKKRDSATKLGLHFCCLHGHLHDNGDIDEKRSLSFSPILNQAKERERV